MDKVWLITGSNRGIGAEVAKAALAAGNRVVATGRRVEEINRALGTADRLMVAALDVTNYPQVNATVEATIAQFGRIDILVNNAGYGQLGVFEETTIEQIRAQYETNVFGMMEVARAVMPIMRRQRSGRIFNISSIGGLMGAFGCGVYNSSKFAVEGFSQAIAQELAPFGIFVISVSPGYFRTDFLDSSSVKYGERSIRDYEIAATSFRAFHNSRSHKQAGDPVKLAAAIVLLAQIKGPPTSFVAGSDAVEWATKAIRNQELRLKMWRELSISTDGDS